MLLALFALQPYMVAANAQSYNLGSTDHNLTATSAANIRVGSSVQHVQVGDRITAGEMAALNQVLNSGRQSIILSSLGAAVAGRVNIVGDIGRSATDLSIPKGITALGDFSRINSIDFSGNLTNSGTLYGWSSSSTTPAAVFNAYNIVNNSGALISTVLPVGGLAGVNHAVGGLGLNLNAVNDILNSGSIRSAGALSLSAGHQISNGSARVSSALVQSFGDLNLSSNIIVNKALLTSTQGNVNISGDGMHDLSINSVGGTVSAANGNINIGSLSTAKYNTTINGGNWFANAMNIDSGNGQLVAALNNVTAVVNVNAGTANVSANSANFQLGNVNVTGDPTFSNVGNFTLSGNISTNGGPLAIVAGGDINAGSATSIDTSNASGDGGNVTLVAGANFDITGNNLNIHGGAGSGGNVNLSPVSVNTTGTNNGGNLQVIAFAGSGTGNISLGNSTTGGGGTGTNGNVNVIAASTSGTSINLGTVTTTGGSGGGGDVGIHNSAVSMPNGDVVVDNTTGAVTSGTFVAGATQVGAGASVGTLAASGNIDIDTGAAFTAPTVTAGGSTTINSSGNVGIGTLTTNQLAVTSGHDITVNDVVTAPGGIVMVASEHVLTGCCNPRLTTDSPSGNAGNITLVAGADYTLNGNNVTINGASATGGDVNLTTGNQIQQLSSHGGGTSGNGGNILLTAFGQGATFGGIYSNGGLTIATSAAGSGNNGSVTIISGHDADSAINVGPIDTTSGNGAAGTGAVSLATSNPLGGVVISTQGANFASVTSGNFSGGSPLANGHIYVGNINVNNAPVNISLGNHLTIGDIFGASTFVGSAVQTFDIGAVHANTILMTAGTDINIYRQQIAPGGIVLVAGEHVLTQSGFPTLVTDNATGNGGNLTVVAGADFTVNGTSVTINGASATGGDINLTTNTQIQQLSTRGLGTDANGGKVTLVAFNQGNSFGGVYVNSGVSILSAGSGNGNNGDVVIVAGHNGDSAIGIGAIDTTSGGGLAGTGSILLSNTIPNTGVPVAISTSTGFGNITAGNFLGGTIQDSGTLRIGNLTVNQAPIQLLTGNFLSGGSISNASSFKATATVDLNLPAITANTIVATALRDIWIYQPLIAPNGLVLVSGGTIITGGGNPRINTSNANGDGGNVMLVAGAAFTTTANSISVTGVSGYNGRIQLDSSSQIQEINTTSSATNGSGGNITMVALTATDNTTGYISWPGSITATTFGNGTGSNGNVTLVATRNADAAINVGSIDTKGVTGGVAGTGSITLSNTSAPTALPVVISTGAGFGSITAGNFLGGTIQDSGTIRIGNLNVNQAPITLLTGNFLSGGNISNASSFKATATVDLNLPAITANTIVATALRDIWIYQPLVAPDGLVLVSGGTIITGGGNPRINTSDANGNGGNVMLVAGAAFTTTANSISITGISGYNGRIQLDNSTQIQEINTTSSAPNGSGGNITMVALTATDNTTGYISWPGSIGATTFGNGTGANGNVTLVATRDGSAAINIGAINTKGAPGGLAGTGSIYLSATQAVLSPNVTISTAAGSTGTITAGDFKGGAINPNSRIQTGDLTVNNAPVTILTGGNSFDAGTISGASLIYVRSLGSIGVQAMSANQVKLIADLDIILRLPVTAPGGILLVAGEHVYSGSGNPQLITDNPSGDGGPITVVAGANFTINANDVTINGPSATGGNIDFGTNTQLQVLSTRGLGTNANGGKVTLIAYDQGGALGGIYSGAITFTTGGSGTGANGDVLMVAGHNGDSAIGIGSINTTGGLSGTGNITLSTTVPNGGLVINTAGNFGKITSGDPLGGAVPANSTIREGALTVDNSTINVITGNFISSGTISGASIFNAQATVDLNLPQITVGNIVGTAQRDIYIYQPITAPGGILLVSARDVITGSGNPQLLTTTSGNAGTVTVVAGAAFTQTGSSVSITGPSPTGGNIGFDANTQLQVIDTRSTGGNGSGGTVNLFAFDNGTNTKGVVRFNPGITVYTGGNGTGNNGNVNMAGDGALNDGGGNKTIQASNINTTGGASGTGVITLVTSTPNASVGSPIVLSGAIGTAGQITSGTLFGGAVNGLCKISASALTTDKADVRMTAGSDLSFGSITGAALVDLNSLTGAVTLPVLTVNRLAVTAGTDIVITNIINAPGGMALVAGRDVVSGSGNPQLLTATSGNAGSITVVAGAAFTQDGSSISITGHSATGGNVGFDANTTLQLMDTRSTGGNGSGGTVNIFAFDNASGKGVVRFNPGFSIFTGGNGTGNNGDVNMAGDGVLNDGGGDKTIQAPNINTTGGVSATGVITLVTSTPNASAGAPIVVSKASGTGGQIISGTLFGGPLNGASKISTSTLTTNNADVRLTAGSNITFGAISGVALFDVNSLNGSVVLPNISVNRLAVTAGTDIVITDIVNAPGGVALVAGRDVFTGSGNPHLQTTTSGNAGDITVVAGAVFTQDGSSISITGASATGGNIGFDANTTLQGIDTRSTGGNGSGGTVNLFAFDNGTETKGVVRFNTGITIFTGGNGTGNNGAVNMAGDGVLVDGGGNKTIQAPNINTAGGATGTGTITLVTSTPNASAGSPIVISKAAGTGGQITSGSGFGGTLDPNARISTSTLTTDNAEIDLTSGGDTTFGFVSGASLFQAVSANGSISYGAINPNRVSLAAGLDINFSDITTAPGGILMVAGRNINTQSGNPQLITASSTANGGNISLVAGAAFTYDTNGITLSGASPTGGRVAFTNATQIQVLSSNSTLANGSAGNIIVAAFAGTDATGDILMPGGFTVTANGSGTGANGNVTMVAGRTDLGGSAINIGGITASTGTGGGGDITLQSSTPGTPTTFTKAAVGFASISSGNLLGGSLVSNDITVNGTLTSPGTVTIVSGRNASINSVNLTSPTNAGTLNITTNGNTVFNVGGGGANSVSSINASGNASGGNAGTVSITNIGSNGVTVVTMPNLSVTSGNGGNIALNADAGALTIPSSISVDGANNGNGGSISLTGASFVNGGVNEVLSANGAGTGNGGSVSVRATVGNITTGTGAGEFNATANGTGGSISYRAAGTVTVGATGSLTADNVSLTSDDAVSGLITLTGNVAGSNSITLTVNGTGTISQSGAITGGTLILNAGTSATALTTTVSALTLNTNGNVTITEADALNFNAGSTGAGALSVSSTGNGDFTILGNVTANGGVTLTTNGNMVGPGTLSSTTGLTVNGGAGTIALNTAVPSLTVTATTLASFTNTNATLNLVSLAGNADLTISTNGSFTVGNPISTTQGLHFTAGDMDIEQPLVAGTTSSLTATNGTLLLNASFSGNGDKTLANTGTGDITIQAPITTAAAGSVTLTANSGTISQSGTGTITATTLNVNLTGGTADLSTLANNVGTLNTNVTAGGSVQLNNGSNNVALGTISGASQNLFVQTTGAIDLTSGFTVNQLTLFAGADLTIDQAVVTNGTASVTLSAGNISIANGSGLTGSGSKVLVNNGTGGIDVSGTLSGPALTLSTTNGGNITEGATGAINSSGGTGLLVNLSGVTPGTATLTAGTNNVNELTGNGTGSISFSNGSNDLAINTFGSQALTVTSAGNLTTLSNITLQSVALTANDINISNSITVSNASSLTATTGNLLLNGAFGGAGSKTISNTGSGNITIQKALGGASIILSTNGGTITQSGTGTITGPLEIDLAGGSADLSTSSNSVTTLNTSVVGSGDINLNNGTNPVALNSISGASQNLTVTTGASISFGSGFSINNLTLSSGGALTIDKAINTTGTANISTSGGDLTLAATGSLGGTGAKILNNSGTGNVAVQGAIGGSSIDLTTHGGNVTQLATGVITTAGTLTVNLLGVTPGTATLNVAANNVGTLSGTGGGGITFDNGANNLNLGTFGGSSQNLTVTTTGSVGTSGANTTVGQLDVTAGTGITISKSINANGVSTITTNGGNISIAAGGLLGDSADMTLNNNGAGNIDVQGTLQTVGGNLVLNLSGGNVTEGAAGNVSSNTGLTINLTGAGTASLTSGNNNVSALYSTGSGAVTLDNGANDLALGTFGASQDLTVTSAGNLTTSSAISVNSVSLTAASMTISQTLTVAAASSLATTGGDLTLTAAFNGAGDKTLTTSANNISIQAPVNATNVGITVGSGTATQTAAGIVTASVLNATANGGTIDLTAAVNPIPTVNVVTTGSGTVKVNTGASALTVNINSGAGNDATFISTGSGTLSLGTLNATNITLSSAGAMQTTSNQTITGALNITTDTFTNAHALSAGTILITNHPGDAIVIDGGAGGSFTGTAYVPGAPGSPGLPGIKFVADSANMTLTGTQTWNGDTEIRCTAGTLVAQAGATLTGTNNVTVKAFVFQNDAPITGNNLIIAVDRTIINTVGDVNLVGDITATGQNFAIVAYGNINTTGLTNLNLSSVSANGGTLNLIAGYSASPSSGGQDQTDQPFTLGAPSPTGGSINLGGTAIDLSASSASGNGGNLVAVAAGGSITLGTVNTASTNGAGGNVTIIGENGVTAGNLSVGGATTNGTVAISVAKPTVTGTITVTDGNVTGGSFSAGAATGGNMSLSSITNASTVTLTGAKNASDTISATGTVTADTLSLIGGAGSINIANSVLNTLNSNSSGSVTLSNEAANLALGTITGASQQLSVTVANDITTTSNLSIQSLGLNAGHDIILSNSVSGTTSVLLNAGNTITQSGGQIGGGALTVDFVNGPVTLSTAVTSVNSSATGQTLTINENDGIQLLGQTVGSFFVNAGQTAPGTLTTGANVSVSGTLSMINADGDISLANNVGSTGGNVILNASGTITQSAGNVSGNGLTVDFVTGPVTLATAVSSLTSSASGQTLTVNEADGIQLLGQTLGSLFVNAGQSAAGNITTGANISVPGTLSLVDANGNVALGHNVTGLSSVVLNASSTITQSAGKVSGGALSVTFASGTVTLATAVTSLTSSGPSSLIINEDDGIQLLGQGVNNLTVHAGQTAAGNISTGANISVPGALWLDSANGDVVLSNNINGTGSVRLDASGTITQSGGKISGGALTVNFVTGPVTLATNVTSLTSSASGQTLTINETDGIQLKGQTLGSLFVNAGQSAAGNITTGADFAVTGTLSLINANGDIVLSNNVGSTGGNVVLNASGTISQSAGKVSGNGLTVDFATGPVTLATAVSSLTSSASGQSLTINEDDGIQLNGQTLGSLSVNAGISAAGTLTAATNISASGNISLKNSNGDIVLNNDLTSTGGDITLNASGTINQVAGKISANGLTLTIGSGSPTLHTAVSTLTSSMTTGTLVIYEDDGIQLLNQNVDVFILHSGQVAAGDITTGGTVAGYSIWLDSTNGNIVLNNNINSTFVARLTASGTITQTAGKITAPGGLAVGFGSGPVTLTTAIGSLTVTAPGQTLTVNEDDGVQIDSETVANLFVNAGQVSAGTVTTNGNTSVTGTLSIVNANGDIFLSNSVGSSGGNVVLDASGTITQTAGKVSGNGLTLNFVTGPVTLATAVSSLSSNAAGQTLTINEDDGIQLLGQNVSNLFVNAGQSAAGNITTGANFSMPGTLSLVNANGNIALSNSIGSTAGNVTLDASGTISQSAGKVSGNGLTVNFGSGSVTLATAVNSVTSSAPGQSLTINEDDSITLLSQNVTNFAVHAGQSALGNISLGTNLSVPGTLVLQTPNGNIGLTNTVNGTTAVTIDGNTITGSAKVSGGALTVNFVSGPVTMTTAVNSVTSSATGQSLTINEDDGIQLLSQGVTNFTVNAGQSAAGDVTTGAAVSVPGTLIINSSAGSIVLSNNIGGTTGVTLNASGTISQTGGTISGGALSVAFGSGPVTLTTAVASVTSNAPGLSLVVNEADAIQLLSQNVTNLTVNAGQVAAGDLSTGADLSVAGSLVLTNNSGNILLSNNVTGTTAVTLGGTSIGQTVGTKISGGALTIILSGGSPTLATSVDSLTTTAPGQSLTINEDDGIQLLGQNIGNLSVNAGKSAAGNITTGAAVSVSGNLSLTNANGDIVLSNNVGSTGGNVLLDASGTINQTAGKLSGNGLTVNFITGPVALTTAVSSVTSTASGQSLTINEDDGIQLLAQNVTNFTVNAGQASAGTVSTGVALSVPGTLTIHNSNGDINLNNDVTGTTGVTLNASGTISQTGVRIFGGALSVAFATGPVTLATDVTSLTSSAAGQTLTINEANAIQLLAQNVGVLNVNAGQTTAGDVTTGANINVAGDLNVNVNNGNVILTNNVTASNINLTVSVVGGSISSTGTISATSTIAMTAQSMTNNGTMSGDAIVITNGGPQPDLTIGGSGTFSSNIATNLIANNGNLNFAAGSNLVFNGLTNMNAGVNHVVVGAGGIVTGTGAVDVTATKIDLGTGSQLTGNPLYFNSPTGNGTIANSGGDVVLPTTLVFSGKSLAILASGNITATTLTTINLSSTTAAGGNLTMVAGYDFSPTASPQVNLPNATTYTLGNPSPSGGSILLPKVSINTSSTAANQSAGNITLIAHGNNTNVGSIFVNGLKASASLTGGTGGSIQIIGQGGVSTGAIDNHAATGNSVSISAAAPQIVGGAVTVTNGILGGTGVFGTSAPVAGSGAAIKVNGVINTSSTVGRGGDVTLIADRQITVTGITATGANAPNALVTSAGGDVLVSSIEAAVSVGATGINVSGVVSKVTGGNGGSITINAPEYITVAGKLTAKGGTGPSGTSGGHGGTIDVETQTLLNGNWIGAVSITGAVDVSGGAGVVATNGNGGDGGSVTLNGGTVRVAATGVSINAAGGLGKAKGNGGTVDINTSATQQLPANFDLTSTALTIPATPGGLFTVGIAAPVNGVAGTINAGTVINKAAVAFSGQGTGLLFASNGTFNPAGSGVTIKVSGPNTNSTDITENTITKTITIADPVTGKRTLVTPSEAVALFQVTRTGTQVGGIVLSSTGTGGGTAQSGSVITVSATELPAAFTAFKMVGVAATDIVLDVTGLRPVLTLPATANISGATVSFAAGTSPFIDFAAGSTLTNVNGLIDATGSTLMLAGTGSTWNVKGAIKADNVQIARSTAGALTLNIATNGSITGTAAGAAIQLSTDYDPAMTMTFKANKADMLPVEFVNATVPTLYQNVALANANTSAKPVALTFSLMNAAGTAGAAEVGGTVNATTLSIKTTAITVSSVSATPMKATLDIDATANFNAATTGIISSVGALTIEGKVTTGTTLTVSTTDKAAPITLNGATLASTTNTTVTSLNSLTLTNATLTAGVLAAGTPTTGILDHTKIIKAGGISLVSNGLMAFVSGDDITSNGGNFTATAKGTLPTTSNMTLGNSNTFVANGGRIVMLATGDVSSDIGAATGNTFYARSTDVATNTGGGIEIGAGTNTSTLSAAFLKPAGTGTNATNGTVVGTNNGAIVLNPSATTGVDLAPAGGTAASTLNLQGHGAIDFDAVGSHTVKIDNASLTTEALKPVNATVNAPTMEVIVDTGADAENEDPAMLTQQF